MSKILVTGSGSGLGALISTALKDDGHDVIEFDLAAGNDVRDSARTFGACPSNLDVLINCAGICRLGWLEEFSEVDWNVVMDTNAKGIFLMAQWARAQLSATKGTILNIASDAAYNPMTCSLAYNASKAAAHMMTRQLARELTRKDGITVFGIAPNKLIGTAMSLEVERQVIEQRGWTPEFAREYQAKTLMTGEETPPALLAEFVAFLLSTKERHRFLSGLIIPYGN